MMGALVWNEPCTAHSEPAATSAHEVAVRRAGSFSADDVAWSVETTLWPTDGTSCDDDDGDPAEYNFADCDGAPCDLAAAFDAEYDATCACPVRNATRFALESASLERLTQKYYDLKRMRNIRRVTFVGEA